MKHQSVILLAVLSMLSFCVASDEINRGVDREVLSSTPLQNVPGYKLTSVTVELQPNVSVPAHYHDGFVFVYVIEGVVLSQLNQEEAVVYSAGDSWIEMPGDQHSLTKNESGTDKAKLLAVFVTSDGAHLTTPGAPDNINPFQRE